MSKNGKWQTILLVEDFDDARFMMRMLLEMDGYRVVEATNGREAVELAKQSCPDLVLMDLSMPEMDGLEAVRHIRALTELCHVPIVAVTAHVGNDYYSAAVASGCDEYLTKPVDFDRLEAVISKLLSGRAVQERVSPMASA